MTAINKVIFGGNTIIDLTDLTVDQDKLLRGYTARRADGNKITGTMDQTIEYLQVGGTVTLDENDYLEFNDFFSASDEGKVVHNGALVSQSSSSITANGTYDTTLINSLNVAVNSGILALIDEYTVTLEEYTSTSSETIDTGINIKNTDYAFGIVTVTCDSAITTTTEWGMSIAKFGRYTSNGNVLNHGTMGQKGIVTLSKSSLISNTISWSSYGVYLLSNTNTIQFNRKCNSSGCPKIRGGVYTFRVYGFIGM